MCKYFVLCLSIMMNVYAMKAAEFATIVEPIIMQAKQLAYEHMQNRTLGIPIIAIAGCSAVGKSYFTNTLMSLLRNQGINVYVVHQDDYLNIDRTFPGFRIHPNLDHESLHTFLIQVCSGNKHIKKPCVVDNQKHVKYKTHNFTAVDLILFEGIYALTGPETYDFVRYCNFGIFIDATTKSILEWHASRNKKRGFFKRVGNSDLKEHASCLLYEYTRFILPSKKRASFVVFKDDLTSYRLLDN